MNSRTQSDPNWGVADLIIASGVGLTGPGSTGTIVLDPPVDLTN